MRQEPVALRVRRIADRQEGVITTRQLHEAGLDDSKIRRWNADGHLARRHRTVYTVGHDAISQRGELIIALFYAGPESALSFSTGGSWWQALAETPRRIHVSATHNRPSTRDIKVHCPRSLERVFHRGLPVTPVPRTVLDCAGQLEFRALRKMIAEAEYRKLATLRELERALAQGRPGTRALRRALAAHQPQLARVRSPLEERFLYFCEEHHIPLPLFNQEICGFTVDAVWLGVKPRSSSSSTAAPPMRCPRGWRRIGGATSSGAGLGSRTSGATPDGSSTTRRS